MTSYERIVILTGAGLSAESGLDTFRDKKGIWSKFDYRDVATPEGFARNPQQVHEFYNMRRNELLKAKPNKAHQALARLERDHPGDVLIVTQNIDHLHEAADSENIIHMHGELQKVFCITCDARQVWTTDLTLETDCPNCKTRGKMRPDVVWFGEMPYRMDEIIASLMQADLFLSIGTSGNVYPAAGFAEGAREAGARTVELNLEPSEGASTFHEAVHGPATEVIPAYVDRLLI
ncbi:MAG: NAD-dependent deacylase [Hyphomicrobiaceae bacterium]